MDDNGQAILIESVSMAKVSYKTKLLGTSIGLNSMTDMEEDFDLLDGDVAMGIVGGVSSITFSDFVQQFIERKMALTVVVKVIGEESCI